jgi:hypothetical protein
MGAQTDISRGDNAFNCTVCQVKYSQISCHYQALSKINHHLVLEKFDLHFTLVHELLKRLITRQNDLSIIQWFHAFAPAAIRSRDIGNVRIDSGCRLRVNPASDTCYECCRNLDFVKNRCGAFHSDSSHDLGIKGELIECLLASPIIGSEGCDGFCDELWFWI